MLCSVYRIHCGVEVTESSTNKKLSLSLTDLLCGVYTDMLFGVYTDMLHGVYNNFSIHHAHGTTYTILTIR
jgi:hypothetical protein